MLRQKKKSLCLLINAVRISSCQGRRTQRNEKSLLLKSRSIRHLPQDIHFVRKQKSSRRNSVKESDFRDIAMRFRRCINTLQSLISKQNGSFRTDFFQQNSDRYRNTNPIKNRTHAHSRTSLFNQIQTQSRNQTPLTP